MRYADCIILRIGTSHEHRNQFWGHVEQNIDFYIENVANRLKLPDPRFGSLWARFRMIRLGISIYAVDVAPLSADIGEDEEKIYDALGWIVLEVLDTHGRDVNDIIKEVSKRCSLQ